MNPETRSFKKKKILVVDDDIISLTITQTWLKLAGYEVITRPTSLGTTMVVKQERPDFVLLDVNMPGLNGEILAKLVASKSNGEGPGIVLFSADDVTEVRKRAQKFGALGAVQKSANRHQFIADLESCFAAQPPRE